MSGLECDLCPKGGCWDDSVVSLIYSCITVSDISSAYVLMLDVIDVSARRYVYNAYCIMCTFIVSYPDPSYSFSEDVCV